MAQNYTEQLRKDNVRDAIYEDLQNNCEVLRTSWSGNAFPANPKVGQPCYRVDEDKLYYWDGYKWSQKGGGGSAELKSMELPAIETERVSIILEGARCLDKNMMFVFVDKIAQDPSTYSMNDDGTVVNFNPAIPANAAVTLRWFDTDVGTFDTAIFASDAEFAAGELTNRAPNVKQVHSLSDQIQTSVENLASDLEGKANIDLSNLSAAGQAKFDAKANVSNTVTTDTSQTISGVKTFSIGSTLRALNPVLLKENNTDEGGQIGFQRSNNSVLKSDPFIDLYQNEIRVVGVNSNNTVNVTLQVDLENKQVLVPTPATTANDTQAATTAWVNSKVGGFANTNASNFTATGKETVVGWGMPDYSAGVDVSGYKAANNQFTAPKNGILSIAVDSNTNGTVYINDTVRAFANNNDPYARAFITLPISKGERFYAPSVLNTTTYTSCFYPFKGVN